jgi:3',5'-cyclic AMP phosphodiesterase CpdA
VIRIAHLSDLHFGKQFNLATWEAVAENVVDFEPDLIIVSGDLVDHPSPAHLLSVKCGLRELSVRAAKLSSRRSPQHPRAAELVVIPGNHDVFEYGNAAFQKRLNWFEQIFNSVAGIGPWLQSGFQQGMPRSACRAGGPLSLA